MATVYDDLLGLGFKPQLQFRNDAFIKVLYLKIREDLDDRMDLLGKVKIPTLVLPNQNKTLKPITGGTRFRLVGAVG